MPIYTANFTAILLLTSSFITYDLWTSNLNYNKKLLIFAIVILLRESEGSKPAESAPAPRLLRLILSIYQTLTILSYIFPDTYMHTHSEYKYMRNFI